MRFAVDDADAVDAAPRANRGAPALDNCLWARSACAAMSVLRHYNRTRTTAAQPNRPPLTVSRESSGCNETTQHTSTAPQHASGDVGGPPWRPQPPRLAAASAWAARRARVSGKRMRGCASGRGGGGGAAGWPFTKAVVMTRYAALHPCVRAVYAGFMFCSLQVLLKCVGVAMPNYSFQFCLALSGAWAAAVAAVLAARGSACRSSSSW